MKTSFLESEPRQDQSILGSVNLRSVVVISTATLLHSNRDVLRGKILFLGYNYSTYNIISFIIIRYTSFNTINARLKKRKLPCVRNLRGSLIPRIADFLRFARRNSREFRFQILLLGQISRISDKFLYFTFGTGT